MFTAVLVVTLFGIGQDSLAAARDLYASAAYEDALAVLNRLPNTNRSADELRAVEQYRALCLLALGRTAEAERAIEAVVAGDPAFRPASDLSPRVRSAFSEVRKRMLPGIIQQKYADAKAAYDRKEFAVAAAGFTKMLEMMTDPDAEAAANRPPLSDLRTLAAGFRDLAETASAPLPARAEPSPSPQGQQTRIYSAADVGIFPPVPLRQDLPPYPGTLLVPKQGVIEVIVDENGTVESAMIRVSVNAQYDALALAAAKTWRYKPASLNGTPVRYRKALQITVKGAK